MSNIIYECPDCHLQMDAVQYETIEYDFCCPRCERKPLSSFQAKALCMVRDCEKCAVKKPLLKVWAKGFSRKTTQPAIMHMDLAVCDEHAVDDVGYYVTDEGWKLILEQFALNRKMEPDRKSLKVEFTELEAIPQAKRPLDQLNKKDH